MEWAGVFNRGQRALGDETSIDGSVQLALIRARLNLDAMK
jgi:hypothetical protein